MSAVIRGARATRTWCLRACLRALGRPSSAHLRSIDPPTFDVRQAVQVLRFAAGMASRRPVVVRGKVRVRSFAADERSWGLDPRAARSAALHSLRNVGLLLLLLAPVRAGPHEPPTNRGRPISVRAWEQSVEKFEWDLTGPRGRFSIWRCSASQTLSAVSPKTWRLLLSPSAGGVSEWDIKTLIEYARRRGSKAFKCCPCTTSMGDPNVRSDSARPERPTPALGWNLQALQIAPRFKSEGA